MKVNFRLFLTMAVVSLFLVAGAVNADPPTVTITSPLTGTIFASAFPFSTSINFTVEHSTLSQLNALDVLQDGTSILPNGARGNPFPSNVCSGTQMIASEGISSCSVSGNTATVSAAWSVPSPGTYSIAVSVKHMGATGLDEEEVTYVLLAVEFPAPPSVANAYINSMYKGVAPKRRGCVISKIAENHAKYEMYGPKGGPYNEDLIKNDVDYYINNVCN